VRIGADDLNNHEVKAKACEDKSLLLLALLVHRCMAGKESAPEVFFDFFHEK
jgi:hypothetical protein